MHVLNVVARVEALVVQEGPEEGVGGGHVEVVQRIVDEVIEEVASSAPPHHDARASGGQEDRQGAVDEVQHRQPNGRGEEQP